MKIVWDCERHGVDVISFGIGVARIASTREFQMIRACMKLPPEGVIKSCILNLHNIKTRRWNEFKFESFKHYLEIFIFSRASSVDNVLLNIVVYLKSNNENVENTLGFVITCWSEANVMKYLNPSNTSELCHCHQQKKIQKSANNISCYASSLRPNTIDNFTCFLRVSFSFSLIANNSINKNHRSWLQ